MCWHWNIDPAPIFLAAAIFVGYRLHEIPGAIAVGLSALLPSFTLVLLVATVYVKVESNPLVMLIVHGIAAGVIGLVISIVPRTGRFTINNLRGVTLVVITFVALAFFKMDPLMLIKAHRQKVYSTDPPESLNAEVKRRIDMVGIFPTDAFITRIVGALLLE